MSIQTKYLALDLGAESGRALLGHYQSGDLQVHEVHRFANEPVRYNGAVHWDTPRLWLEIQRSLSKASAASDGALASIGVDSWGLDFALLGEGGRLLDNPYHYRDSRTEGMVKRVCEAVPAKEIYGLTGVQFMSVNSLYQLYALSLRAPALLRFCEHLVTMPDLFNFWLTGSIACEFTNATTTQFCDPRTKQWTPTLLERLGIPTHFLAPIVDPGTLIGPLREEVARPAGLARVLVIAPACHDTGSAVAAISAQGKWAFISSGTWSLLGTVVTQPVINETSHRLNFTNEGGVCGTTRLLKNIAGLWVLQSCRRSWETDGKNFTYADLMEMASHAPGLQALIDPDAPAFLRSENMPASIAEYCIDTGQQPPRDEASYCRTVIESLAFKYRLVLNELEELTDVTFDEIRIVGGGSRNRLLNQMTAEATGKRVVAGPAEATALGNLAIQMLATGAVASLRHAHEAIDRSFPAEIFEPKDPRSWESAYPRFRQYCARP
jgi:rhamnulokinase